MDVNRQFKTRSEREAGKPAAAPAPKATLAGLSRGILLGLQGKHVYQGTAEGVAGRRAKNRTAAASRRTNRRRSA